MIENAKEWRKKIAEKIETGDDITAEEMIFRLLYTWCAPNNKPIHRDDIKNLMYKKNRKELPIDGVSQAISKIRKKGFDIRYKDRTWTLIL